MVGAVTVLIAILAVFLAYNANSGLPFVPTYKISATVPDANTLLPGNEVRIGGVRVGVVEDVTPIQDEDGERQRASSTCRWMPRPRSFRSIRRSSFAPAPPSASSTWRSSAAPPATASLPARSCRPRRRSSCRWTSIRSSTPSTIPRGPPSRRTSSSSATRLLVAGRPQLGDRPAAATAAQAHARDDESRQPGDQAGPVLLLAHGHGGGDRPGSQSAGGHVRRAGHHVHVARLGRAPVHPGDDLRGSAHARRRAPRRCRGFARSCRTARRSSPSSSPGSSRCARTPTRSRRRSRWARRC